MATCYVIEKELPVIHRDNHSQNPMFSSSFYLTNAYNHNRYSLHGVVYNVLGTYDFHLTVHIFAYQSENVKLGVY